MLINIDCGHGSNTPGKRTPPFPRDVIINDKITIKKGEQFPEHIADVGVAVFLVEELKRCGIKTMRTGWDDKDAYDDDDEPLAERQRRIAKAKCDYSISIHFNAYGDGKSFNDVNGMEIYIHDTYFGQSAEMAKIVLEELIQGRKQSNRGVKKQSLAMCNCETMKVKGAILIELAFMTNKQEATELMANEAYWKESAIEIAKGICRFTGIKYVAEKYVPNKSITAKSSVKDIMWAQERLNIVLPNWFPRLVLDGSYGPKTRIGVLIYWDSLGWGRHMNDDGTVIGKSTREKLSQVIK